MSILCSLPIVANLIAGCAPVLPVAVGFVEGEHVLLAPVEVTTVSQILIRRGQSVEAGEPLAKLESQDAEIAVAAAKAQLAQARSQLADLRQGRRPEELAVLEAARNAAAVQLAEAQRASLRVQSLSRRGITTTADSDQASTQLDVAKAQLAQAEASLSVAKLPARDNAILAGEHQVEAAGAALSQAEWRLSKRVITAPAKGTVSDLILTTGDTAGPSAPVMALLPDGAVKLKLYFPQAELPRLKPGTELAIHCDNCPDDLKATVSFVSSEPEFTPPVIYSLENRQKLVFLVEALEAGGRSKLMPGQIVDADYGVQP
ncbi:MAG: HlyD family efflux transporter periplasmic adaptor subunit [Rhizobiaceae bacterium]